jgi:hypothetical protein
MQSCVFCHGLGSTGEEGHTCKCVWRSVFSACLQAFKEADIEERHHVSQFVYESGHARTRPNYRMYEFAADFLRVSRLALLGHDLEWKVFRLHMLHGVDNKTCCLRLKIDRGTFFHKVFWIQVRLGRAFAELSPYALFPVGEYLQPTVKK